MPRNKHTTIRLSPEGEARLQRLAQHHGSQVAAMEAALTREMCAVFTPESAAADPVLESVRKHVALALATIDQEFGRRADVEWSGEIL